MKKTLPTLLIGACAALAGTAQAQSSTSLYGLIDMSAGQFQSAGATKYKKVESGQMSTSYFGLAGSEDLGGGINAKFALESFLRADVGGAGRFGADAFWARNAYVGVAGQFGTVTLGRNTTTLFVSTLLFNAFGDSFGFSPAIRHTFTSFDSVIGDTGWNNSVRYDSPKIAGGLTIAAMANANEGTGTGGNLAAQALYFGGPFGATFAWQRVKNPSFGTPAGFNHQDTFNLGGSYDLTVAKLFAQYTEIKTDATLDKKSKLYEFGAAVPVGPGKVLAQYGQSKCTGTVGACVNAKVKTLTAGYDYALSKRTDAYAVYMNDKAANLNTGNTFAVGVRHKF